MVLLLLLVVLVVLVLVLVLVLVAAVVLVVMAVLYSQAWMPLEMDSWARWRERERWVVDGGSHQVGEPAQGYPQCTGSHTGIKSH